MDDFMDEPAIGDLSLSNDWDLEQQIEWNSDEPSIVHDYFHRLFETQVRIRPDAPAIDAEDGHFTYAQLNQAANRLASHISSNFHPKPNQIVHVCFEKSAYYFVAILAINKAGAAWSPLDPSHPPQRQQQVVEQTGAQLALASSTQSSQLTNLIPNVIEVTAAFDQQLTRNSPASSSSLTPPASDVTPRDAAYVLFTSGSTGTPKGFVMEHRAVCTSQTNICARLRLTPQVRILQFAAFVFDLSVGEIIAPLISGACICVPSDTTRVNDIEAFIHTRKVNWAFLTPSFARTLRLRDLPSLELLLLAGEAVSRDVLNQWFGHVRLVNGWGPAETCVFSTLHEWTSKNESPLTVGRPVGCSIWIVDPEDPEQLAPSGTVGEAVIQGPTLLREYLADPEATSAAVTQVPQWTPRRDEQCFDRLYKSGDLCSYNADGTVEFSGRKDTQIKIRGQRVELGEIEHQIRTHLDQVKQVAVHPVQKGSTTTLAAAFCFSHSSRPSHDIQPGDIFLPLENQLADNVAALIGTLNVLLPSYMVPSVFLPCKYMPFVTSTKLDRKYLEHITSAMSQEEMLQHTLQMGQGRPPETDMEKRFQLLWAEILNISAESISRDHSFLGLGGDSLVAIQMVSAAREDGINITVQQIFNDPRLLAVASKATATTTAPEVPGATEPFSLLSQEQRDLVEGYELRQECGLLDEQTVEDVYPCSSLQEGLMALGVKQPGSYIAKQIYRLSDDVHIEDFRSAWEQTVETCDTLRARIVDMAGSSLQVVTQGPVRWEQTKGHNLQSYISHLKSTRMGYGDALSRYAIIQEEGDVTYFVWISHHAVFDGWSSLLVFRTLDHVFTGRTVSDLQPYAGFIKHTMTIDPKAADNFWNEQLRGARRAAFPPRTLSPSSRASTATKITKKWIEVPELTDSATTKATILRAAWAIVLSRYCDSEDVTFGSTVSGRNAAIPGLQAMVGPVVATVPVRVRFDRQQTVFEFLASVQSQANKMVEFEQYGIQKISKLGADAKEACDFSTLLVIQPMDKASGPAGGILETAETSTEVAEDAIQNYFSYPLVNDILIYEDSVQLHFTYKTDALEEAQLTAMAEQFQHVVNQLVTKKQMLMKDVSVAGPWDLQRVTSWNEPKRGVKRALVHDLFSQQAAQSPDREALYSSDGSLNYKELNEASTNLAHHLSQQGVRIGTRVPFCFEKSIWAVVAMLGILKAGGVFVPLDPSHPHIRREGLVREVGAMHLITSPSNQSVCHDLVPNLITLSSDLLSSIPLKTQPPTPQPSPDDTAYVLFTSGSTGKPKAIVVDHTALSTSITGFGRAYAFGHETRTLQFSSYVFDVSLSEILETLTFGGTVCVPTESERLGNIPQFVSQARTNTALLTSSFLRTLDPADMESIELLLLVGEPPTSDIIESWVGKAKVVNAYGPSEASIFCASHVYDSRLESPTNIGQAFSGALWITDVDNVQRMAPIGCTGEILLQRHLARGYLNDKTGTRASFIDNVNWLPPPTEDDTTRFYKTGDLGRYNADGTIEYLGRNDSQVKVRGYRVELGEIEAAITKSEPRATNIAVDVVRRDESEQLVAFISFGGDEDEDMLLQMTDGLRSSLRSLADALKTLLPGYMVPSIFLPMRKLPTNTSMKVNRLELRQLAGSLTAGEAASFSLAAQEKVEPSTDAEFAIRELWAQVLYIDPETIGKTDLFLEIGGDSITAIRLTSLAQERGINLTVAQIFADSRLCSVAAASTRDTAAAELEPFSLLPATNTLDDVLSAIRSECGLSDDDSIHDAFPCTPLQEGLIALTVKQPRSYITRSVFKLPADLDVDRFRSSWDQTVSFCSNLRTRIALVDGVATQAIIDSAPRWDETNQVGLAEYMRQLGSINMTYGSRLCRYALIQSPDDDATYFVWTMHHSIYDGWTSTLVLDTLSKLYQGSPAQDLKPYSGFINHVKESDQEFIVQYWTDHLEDASASPFPKLPRDIDGNVESDTQIMITRIELSHDADKSVTRASIIRAVWAMVLSRYCDTDDVCFGTTVSGRNADVPGLVQMTGPTIASIPVRMQIDRDQRVSDFLASVQKQSNDMVPYEQFGLQNISRLNQGAKKACDFHSLLVIQPGRERVVGDDGIILPPPEKDQDNDEGGLAGHFNYPLIVEGKLYTEYSELQFVYDSAVLHPRQVEALSHHLSQAIDNLTSQQHAPLNQISIRSAWDVEVARSCNQLTSPKELFTLHGLVERLARETPEKDAIYSTALSITYSQLDHLANKISQHLVSLNVGPGSVIPICSEKSVWVIIGMLGIMRTGAAFTPMDPEHPRNRRQMLVKDLDAHVMLASSEAASEARNLCSTVVELGEDKLSDLAREANNNDSVIPSQDPKTPAYILFTSGTTGKPKGIVVEHGGICHSVLRQGETMGMTQGTRFLQFANYAFDACITEIFTTLAFGGTVCVPVGPERLSETAVFINSSRANTALLTPSFCRTLSPRDVPGVKTLLLGGEAPTKDLVRTWQPCARLFNVYGPTETCVMCVLNEFTSPNDKPTTVGRGFSSPVWVVDVNDRNRLTPVGCVGELVAQGPSIAAGYLNDQEKTDGSFVTGINDLPDLGFGNRFYLTGDLVKTNVNGTIDYVGRRDQQVKIRGQRVELGEIEYHIQASLPHVDQVGVDVVTINERQVLVGFVTFDNLPAFGTPGSQDSLVEMDDYLRDSFMKLSSRLRRSLAQYMVPSIFIPLGCVPYVSSMKLDRKKLKGLVSELPSEVLTDYLLSNAEQVEPTTEMEFKLRDVWADVLKISSCGVGKDDAFLEIGGDSISAIQLVSLTRQRLGVELTVSQIFADSRLSALAESTSATTADRDPLEPFQLLPSESHRSIFSTIRSTCGLNGDQVIEDVYPCIPVQEGLMAIATKNPRSYILKHVYRLPEHVDIKWFKQAWENTVHLCPNLRTRIANIDGKSFQAVIKGDSVWEPTPTESIRQYMKSQREVEMSYGSKLCRCTLFEDDGVFYFVWIMHHAVFDGWSVNLAIDTLHRLYAEHDPLPLVPYSSFVEYTTQLNHAAASYFWTQQTKGASRASFPPRTPSRIQDGSSGDKTRLLQHKMNFIEGYDSSVTKATVVRAAWAILLARYSETKDICFGTTISGRNAPVPGLENVSGPTVATVPIHIKLDMAQDVNGYLKSVQAQSTDMILFEQFGMKSISELGPEAKAACDFSSLLIIQPADMKNSDVEDSSLLAPADLGDDDDGANSEGYYTYPLVMQVALEDSKATLIVSFDSTILGELQVTALCHQFEHLIEQLQNSNTTLDQISPSSPWDLQQAREWANDQPSIVQDTVTNKISKHVHERPNQVAIFSTAETMTYGQLDLYSTLLAKLLTKLGVRAETVVPFCFEKSAWAIVAMVGIMKAGGVFMPLDPSHPRARRQDIIDRAEAKIAIVSPNTSEACEGLVAHTIELSATLLKQLKQRSETQPALHGPSPNDTAYILFTSGSTGKPKAIVVDHSALCSSIMGMNRAYTPDPTFRMLQFSNYTFDVSLAEILETLVFGGTVCVPSDRERIEDVGGFVGQAEVNAAMLTSSFLQTMHPTQLPSIKTLMLVGEPPTQDTVDKWYGHAELINAYGPSEASIFCSSYQYRSASDKATTIGKAFSGDMWIVEPHNPQRLAPIGCVGEVLLQRHMARGYLDDNELTRASFFDSAEWLPQSKEDARRFYKTGDLARYNIDGNMEYIGRLDTQIKLRGFRIELGEIEYAVKRGLQNVGQVAVDVVKHGARDVLVAFLSFDDHPRSARTDESLLVPLDTQIKARFSDLVEELQGLLPKYMLPDLYIPLKVMPRNTSFKIDRQALRRLGEELSSDEVKMYGLAERQMVSPKSDAEHKMRDLWAETLQLDAETISRTDRFLEIGGDSLSAIRLVSLAGRRGMQISVPQIFEDSRLSRLADLATSRTQTEVAESCSLEENEALDDTYQCTPLQEGLMALTAQQPTSYVARTVYRLPAQIDLARFRRAWEQTVEACDNLRTRLIVKDGSVVQVLVATSAFWYPTEKKDLNTVLEETQNVEMGYDTSLSRYALVEDTDSQKYFVWIVHHAVIDGWSSALITSVLQSFYWHGKAPSLQPYSSFIRYMNKVDSYSAGNFWKSHLSDAKRTVFPTSTSKSDSSAASLLQRTISFPRSEASSITQATVIRAAWCLLLSRYTDSDDVTFGVTVSGRNAPVAGIAEMAGPTIATIPVRVRIDRQEQVSQFLETLQTQGTDSVPYEQYGLQNIARLGDDAKAACDFTSLLVVQPGANVATQTEEAVILPTEDQKVGHNEAMGGQFNYPLVLEANMFGDKVELHFVYDNKLHSEAQLDAVAHHFDHLVEQLMTDNGRTLDIISLTGQWDLDQALALNKQREAQLIDRCMHDAFREQASRDPDHEAIFSWDGKLTYAELNNLSDRLASYLVHLGVTPETFIPICFEKSMWTIVAMLGIFKAGGAFVPLDPSHPRKRHETLVSKLAAEIMVVSSEKAVQCHDLVRHVVELSPAFISTVTETSVQTSLSPDNAAYALFTSGSTGMPKGVVVHHSALCSSIHGQGQAFGLGPDSRVSQFSNYVFDMSLAEILSTLTFGGTVCIPSESQRLQDTSGFMTSAGVNLAMFTPSFARTLKPSQVPTLKTLVVGGEAPGRDTLETWLGKVNLINGYGPTETTMYCSTHKFQPGDTPKTIGIGTNNTCWIVDPADHNKLAPIGCTGELVIQGHLVARGYKDEPELTEKAFISGADWLPAMTGTAPRLYKTGDLVRYSHNGTLEYVGRRDGQAKIRGQRLELAEIEYAIKAADSSVENVAVDIVTTKSRESLVAFVQIVGLDSGDRKSAASDISDDLLVKDDAIREIFTSILEDLQSRLPAYMVPAFFFPMRSMPFVSAMKIDRRKLRSIVEEMTSHQRRTYSLGGDKKKLPAPTTDMELKLQELMCKVLHVHPSKVGKHSSFIGVGGDSISAIQLISVAQQAGIGITVAQLYEDPRLSAVASKAVLDADSASRDPGPFELLESGFKDKGVGEIRQQCQLTSQQRVEDAYPCTSMQEGLMALAVKQPGSYMAKFVYKLEDDVDLARFRSAWEHTLEVCTNLRTRMAHVDGKAVQAVISASPDWELVGDRGIKAVLQDARRWEMAYGSTLCRYALVEDEGTGDNYFVWVMHHAIYDGWSFVLNMNVLKSAYDGPDVAQPVPFSRFIDYICSIDKDQASKYWTSQLKGASKSEYPRRSPNVSADPVTRLFRKQIPLPKPSDASVTKATVLRAAWAVVLARYCDAEDVTFGTTVSGRNAKVAGLTEMTGPMITTLPVNIAIPKEKPTAEFLNDVQAQATDMIPYEQFGLQNISKLGPGIREACDFSSLLVIQPASDSISNDGGSNLLLSAGEEIQGTEQSSQNYFSYPLVVQGFLSHDHVEFLFTYNASVLGEGEINSLSHHYEHVVQELLSCNKPLKEIEIFSSYDVEWAVQANTEIIGEEDNCFHDLVKAQAVKSPDSVAIQAHDVVLTYAQLDGAASQLAQHLIEDCDVKTGDMVPVCFEKSAWFFVSILAINKAGAAWVPLDPSHPTQRLRHIVDQTKTDLILSSDSNADKVKGMANNVVKVTADLHKQLAARYGDSEIPDSVIGTNQAVYVLFTSGSTGTPKGLVMSHKAVATSQTIIARRLGLSQSTRTLQFAAFVFDMFIGEMFGALISGGCLCVPSDHDRLNSMTEYVRAMNINTCYMTPSLARTIRPEEVPCVEKMVLAGEAVSKDVFEQWVGRVRFFNGWGPAETCVFSTLHEWKSESESPLTIGRPVACSCWIVEPEAHDHLAPTGTVGEVLIQGPTLLREYLADPKRTSDAMVTSAPRWLPEGDTFEQMFKSGDLCRYNPDGTLEFVSRKDTQVKIRGLRVELGDIEHHVRTRLDEVRQVAVDVFQRDGGVNLVAYICFSDETKRATDSSSSTDESSGLFVPMNEELQTRIRSLISQLSIVLPSYMIPTLFMPCRYMPTIVSTKLDRKLLRATLESMPNSEFDKFTLRSGEAQPPQTATEARVQKIWSTVLNIPTESIGREDSFLHIGGDSITVLQFIAAARTEGLSLAAKDVFNDPRLSAVSNCIRMIKHDEEQQGPIEPFDLLNDTQREAILDKNTAIKQCKMASAENIEDAYPCSALQQGFMALAVKQPGSYITQYIYRLPSHIDIPRFKAAWDQAVRLCSCLRTRIVKIGDTPIQVLLKDDTQWAEQGSHNLKSYVAAETGMAVTYGSPLNRYAVIDDDGQGSSYFVWSSHHAIMDGWTLRLVYKTLHSTYHDLEAPPLVPYAGFIRFSMNLSHDTAKKYWKTELAGAQRAHFPPSATSHDPDRSTNLANMEISLKAIEGTSFTKATILRAAVAIVLAKHNNSDDVTFGSTVSGRNGPVEGLQSMPGPCIATVPLRTRLEPKKRVDDNLQAIQVQYSEMTEYEQFGLQNISKLGSDERAACEFQTLLVIQPDQKRFFTSEESSDDQAIFENPDASRQMYEAMDEYFNYPLVIMASLLGDAAEIQLFYYSSLLNDGLMKAMLHQIDHVAQQLMRNHSCPLSDISLVGPWETQHAIDSHRLGPEVQGCVHHAIEEQMSLRAGSTAIASWDGDVTYGDLGSMSTRLAHKLQTLGVGPNVLVPFCFPKSRWAVVSMVAVEMAGGAFVPLDPSAPTERHKSIIEDTEAHLILIDSSSTDNFQELDTATLVIDETFIQSLPEPKKPVAPTVTPDDACFVVFTSGSTGHPKGMILDHRAICTWAASYCPLMDIGPDTRIFNFSSYAFDVGIYDVLGPLMRGGSVCIPSEHDRVNNLGRSIRQLDANLVFLTPSVVRSLTPAEVPDLKVLLLGGEAIPQKVVDIWKDNVSLQAIYGPAETSISCWQPDIPAASKATNLGHPVCSAYWVVHPENPKALTPVGCVGELLIQGPMLARGYISSDNNSAANWLEDVDWLPSQVGDRAYLSGDLVRRMGDGSFEYMGRKDSQVKLHGQRIELGEIEAHMLRHLPSDMAGLVDVISHSDEQHSLMAMLWYTSGPNSEITKLQLAESITDQLRDLVSHIKHSLSQVLFTYMVPSTYLVFQGIPENTVSGKVDQRRLREIARATTVEDRLQWSPEHMESESPTTPMELKLRELWVEILDIETDIVGKEASFLDLGGDSISAIQLVTLAQQHDIHLTVASIFQDPRLSSLAKTAEKGEAMFTDVPERLDLLPAPSMGAIKDEIVIQCQLQDHSIVEDAYPCTKLQEGYMTGSLNQPGAFVSRRVYRLPDDVDLNRFKLAWEHVVRTCTVLRTRLILHDDKIIQVIVKDDMNWIPTEKKTLPNLMDELHETLIPYGSPLCRYAMVDEGQRPYFVLVLHHAIFDGYSTSVMFKMLHDAYQGMTPAQPEPFSKFISYLTSLDSDAAANYWTSQLDGAIRAEWPERKGVKGVRRRDITRCSDRELDFSSSAHQSITKATILRAAYGIVLAHWNQRDEISFSSTLAGRQAPVEKLDEVVGPTISRVPTRVRVDLQKTVSEFLSDVQAEAMQMAKFEQYGPQNIAKLSDDAAAACDASSLLIVQPVNYLTGGGGTSSEFLKPDSEYYSAERALDGFYNYSLVLHAFTADDGAHLGFVYDREAVSEAEVDKLLGQIAHVTQQLRTQTDMRLVDVRVEED